MRLISARLWLFLYCLDNQSGSNPSELILREGFREDGSPNLDILGRIKVKIEKTAVGAAPTTQRKVITGK